jgi:hypothetical protein
MDRRKFVIGAGSLAAGGAAALGTGAFSSVEANRTLDIAVKGDASSYLRMVEGPNENVAEDVVDITSGTVELDFNGDAAGDTDNGGLNQNAVTQFANVLTVENQGTTEVIFGVDTTPLNDKSWIENFNVFAHGDDGSPEYDGSYFDDGGDAYPPSVSTPSGNQDELVDLGVGHEVDLSFAINTNDESKDPTPATIEFIAIEKGGRNDNTQGDNF